MDWQTPRKSSRPGPPRDPSTLVTPELAPPTINNRFAALSDADLPDLTQNRVARQLTQYSSTSSLSSDTGTTSSSNASSTDTEKDEIMEADQDTTLTEIKTQLEAIQPGINSKVKERVNLAHVTRYREALGTALGLIPCRRHEGGHSWLVDTPETYEGRLGADSTLPQMPSRPKETTTQSSSAEYKQYKRDLAHFLTCEDI